MFGVIEQQYTRITTGVEYVDYLTTPGEYDELEQAVLTGTPRGLKLTAVGGSFPDLVTVAGITRVSRYAVADYSKARLELHAARGGHLYLVDPDEPGLAWWMKPSASRPAARFADDAAAIIGTEDEPGVKLAEATFTNSDLVTFYLFSVCDRDTVDLLHCADYLYATGAVEWRLPADRRLPAAEAYVAGLPVRAK